jgi:hypothetical protein
VSIIQFSKIFKLQINLVILKFKSWFTLAGWCYKWGRKSVDNARLVSTFSWFYMKFYLILTFLDFITSLTVYYQRHWFTVYSMGQMSYCHHFANVVFSFIDEVFWNYWTQWRERAGMFHRFSPPFIAPASKSKPGFTKSGTFHCTQVQDLTYDPVTVRQNWVITNL